MNEMFLDEIYSLLFDHQHGSLWNKSEKWNFSQLRFFLSTVSHNFRPSSATSWYLIIFFLNLVHGSKNWGLR